MIRFKDSVRIKPETITSRSNPQLAKAVGSVAVIRIIEGRIVAATVQFDGAGLKHVPVGDLLPAN